MQNSTINTTYSLPNAHFGGEQWPFGTGSSVDPRATHTPVTSIQVAAYNSSGSTNCLVSLRVVNTALTTIVSSNTQVLTGGLQTLDFTFNSASLFEDNIYQLYLNSGSPGNPCNLSNLYTLNFGANNDGYPYATGFDITNSATSTKDIYFIVNGGYSTISFTDTPTSTCNFSNFKFTPSFSTADLANCSTATSTCSQGVAMNANTNTTTYLYNTNYGNIASFSFPTYIPNPFTFVSGTVYNARAYICSSDNQFDCRMGVGTNNNILAYSEPWQFIVNGLNTCSTTYYSQSEIPPPGATTSTELISLRAQAAGQCDAFNDGTVLGGVVWGLCKVMVYLFVPSDDSLNNYRSLQAQVQNKPPFGYISVFTNQLSQFSSSTSSTPSVSTSTYFSTSSLSTLVATPWYGSVRTIIGYIFWLLLLLYLYWRAKHFSLQG